MNELEFIKAFEPTSCRECDMQKTCETFCIKDLYKAYLMGKEEAADGKE